MSVIIHLMGELGRLSAEKSSISAALLWAAKNAKPEKVGNQKAKELREILGPAVVCAWCRKRLRDGVKPVSHGVCAECKSLLEKGEWPK